MADNRRTTEVANRSRIATWMRKVNAKVGGATVTNSRSLLRATSGEQAVLRTLKTRSEYSLSTRVDTAVGSHSKLRGRLTASAGEQQLRSQFGGWESKATG